MIDPREEGRIPYNSAGAESGNYLQYKLRREYQREYLVPCDWVCMYILAGYCSTTGTGAITRVVVDRGYGEGMGL